MLKHDNNGQTRLLQKNKPKNMEGSGCKKRESSDVCTLPYGRCGNQQKVSGEPNSFTVCKWAHMQPLK